MAVGGIFLAVFLGWCSAPPAFCAEQPATSHTSKAAEQPWLEPIPVPADPELEEQIQEIQQALSTLHQQMVRRKEAVQQTADAAAKAKLQEELGILRKEREGLERLLHDLVEEAKASEQTVVDDALARARWLEREQERWDRTEELIRDRQQ